MSTPIVYNGQGPIDIGTFDPARGRPETGYLVNLANVGCANRTLKTSFKQDSTPLTESDSGQRLTFKTLYGAKTCTIDLEMLQFDRAGLAAALYGSNTLISAGSVTGEDLADCAAGDIVYTGHPGLDIDPSAATPKEFVVTDSAGTPAELTAGIHYRILSAAHGRIEILDLTGFTLPLVANYWFKAHGRIGVFAATRTTRGIIFNVVNTADGDSTGRLIVPKIDFEPTSSFDWLTDKEQPITLTGEALYIPELAAGAPTEFGPFMKVEGLFSD